MKHEQVADGVHRFYDRVTNWYLVERDGQVTLVDVAYPRSWPAIQASVRTIGRHLGDVRAVVVTHGHADHFGAAEEARRSLGIPVHAHRVEIPRMNGERKGGAAWAVVPKVMRQLWRPAAWVYLVQETKEGFLSPTWVKRIVPVEDGQTIDAPGSLQVVHLPGHTRGHCGFYLPDAGVLFSGDEIVTRDPLKGKPGPCLMPRELNDDHELAVASLDRLDGMTAELLLPGHGAPWRGPLERAVELARAAHES